MPNRAGDYGDGVRRFVEGLEAAGFSLTWSPIGHAPIAATGPLILASDAIVALGSRDRWEPGTYHVAEIRFGLGIGVVEPGGPIPFRDAPLPVFIYVEDRTPEYVWSHPIETGLIVVLPDDPEEAVAAVQARLDVRETD